jgi:hypothetical protein
MVWWLEAAAAAVRKSRTPVDADKPTRRGERIVSELISASFDLYRDLRDAASEAGFFQLYGNLFLLNPPDESGRHEHIGWRPADARSLPHVQQALQRIESGGYAEAVARAAYMLLRKDEPLPVWRLQLRQELMEEYRDLLPDIPPNAWRSIRGEQEIITRFEPQRALATLPTLLADADERRRFLTLLHRLLADERVQPDTATPQQREALRRIQEILGDTPELLNQGQSGRLATAASK